MTSTLTTPAMPVSLETTLSGANAADLTRLVEAAFATVIGAERSTRLASLNMDFPGASLPGEAVITTAWIERSTRTLSFVSADIRRKSDRCVIAAASGVLCLLSNPAD